MVFILGLISAVIGIMGDDKTMLIIANVYIAAALVIQRVR